jgi:hypothetical protein
LGVSCKYSRTEKYINASLNPLSDLSLSSDIVIPEIVIQEIKRQKKKTLESNRKFFLNNPLHTILDVNKATTKDFNVENYIQKLVMFVESFF